MTDLSAFSDAGFDPKQFINQACAPKTGEEPLERFLAELEMKLHLSAEDVGLYLQDHSARAQQRIPAAAKELLRIKDDVASLRASAAAALRTLEDAGSGQAAAVVGQLTELDLVKRRMEDACSTLKEAAGLSALFQQVEEHFASGNLRRVADALAGMRRGLAVVGDSVAEFRGGRDRLARLEERFAGMVEAPLTTAFSKQQGEEAAALSAMLGQVGRVEAVERLYCAARLPPLVALWEGYSVGTPFASWLPGFYEQVAHALQGECSWVAGALPESCPALPLALLGALLAKFEKPFKQRLGVAMAASAGSVMPLEHLEQVQAAACDFAAALHAALASAAAAAGGALTPAAFAPTHARLLAPVEEAVLQYGDRELAYLGVELQQIAAKGTAQACGEAGAAALEATIAPALSACEAALARCLKLTSGTALPALARVLDRAVQQYASAVQAAVAGMRRRLGAEGASSGGEAGASGGTGEDAAAESAEAVLPLLTVASQLVQRLALLEAGLRQATAEVAPALLESTASAAGEELPPAAALRLAAQPSARQQLAAFAANAASGAQLLPLAAAAVADLDKQVGGCVLEVLMQRPRAQLAPLLRLSEWQQRSAGGAGLALPTFSAYPLQYITSVGEYLMMLPQQLESALLTDDNGEEAGQLVADWIDKVALATAAHYQQQLAAVGGLTPAGAAQLAADLEYFCNVLSTLGVAVPPSLAAWQVAAAAPAEGYASVAEAAAEGGGSGEAAAVVQLVARLRGLQLAPAAAT